MRARCVRTFEQHGEGVRTLLPDVDGPEPGRRDVVGTAVLGDAGYTDCRSAGEGRGRYVNRALDSVDIEALPYLLGLVVDADVAVRDADDCDGGFDTSTKEHERRL